MNEPDRRTIDNCISLIDTLYSDRVDFTIVGLTGYTGTGCTRLADIMCSEFKDWKDRREPADLIIPDIKETDNEVLMQQGMTNHNLISKTIFSRKYTICYNFAQNHYCPFRILKYSHALLFYTLQWVITKRIIAGKIEDKEKKKEELINALSDILKQKYRPSRDGRDNDYRKVQLKDKDNPPKCDFSVNTEGNGYFIWESITDSLKSSFNYWDNLIEAFELVSIKRDKDEPDREIYRRQAMLFFGMDGIEIFRDFMEVFNKVLWTTDPYCTDFFYHRLGYVLRATGDPTVESGKVMDKSIEFDSSSLYVIADLINHLIKGYKDYINGLPKKKDVKPGHCRIVIDKLRNSLEAKFLKERYSAFYLIATHEEREVKDHLLTRLAKNYNEQCKINEARDLIEMQVSKILALDEKERDGKHFEEGRFFAQNLGQCVADAEIHISNESGMGRECPYFYSMSEQWMKYACLIQHPGLITPSSEERCMVVAYTAKFNSGCISRQVGAVITNRAHTIRTIGWNDIPYGQVPCGLRELPTMAVGQDTPLNVRKYIYSEYETGDRKRLKDGNTFNYRVRLKYCNLHLSKIDDNPLMVGLPYPYCFKGLQNEFEGEKNQVHIRSLHAEENAILQMAKYGGEGLQDGIIYVTASPCELCCKKLYQIGVRKIVYIDEYPGISRENIIACGFNRPKLKQFQGAYGSTYFKLYQPIISYKEELAIRTKPDKQEEKKDYSNELIKILKSIGIDPNSNDSVKQLNEILAVYNK